jgi:hypothetical protein
VIQIRNSQLCRQSRQQKISSLHLNVQTKCAGSLDHCFFLPVECTHVEECGPRFGGSLFSDAKTKNQARCTTDRIIRTRTLIFRCQQGCGDFSTTIQSDRSVKYMETIAREVAIRRDAGNLRIMDLERSTHRSPAIPDNRLIAKLGDSLVRDAHLVYHRGVREREILECAVGGEAIFRARRACNAPLPVNKSARYLRTQETQNVLELKGGVAQFYVPGALNGRQELSRDLGIPANVRRKMSCGAHEGSRKKERTRLGILSHF